MSEHNPIEESLDRLLQSSLKARKIAVPEGFSARMLAAVRRREYQAALDQVTRRERCLTAACILVPLVVVAIFRAFPDLAFTTATVSRDMAEALRRVAVRIAAAEIGGRYLLVLAAVVAAVGYAVYDWVFANSAAD